MGIKQYLSKIVTDLRGAYSAIDVKGGTIPAHKNTDNLADAITSIPTGGGVGIPRGVDSDGTMGTAYLPSNTTYTVPAGVTKIASYALYNAFAGAISDTQAGTDMKVSTIDLTGVTNINGNYGASRIAFGNSATTTIIAPDLSSVGAYGLDNAFVNSGLTGAVSFPALTWVGDHAFYRFCYSYSGSNNVTSFSAPSLKTISSSYQSHFQQVCYKQSGLTSIDFSSLETVKGQNTFSSAFGLCTSLTTVTFPALKEASGNNAFYRIFTGCSSLTSVSFPSFNPSLSTSSALNSMLDSCSGVTVHFPSSAQSAMSSWTSVTNGFGGSSTTVSFDL